MLTCFFNALLCVIFILMTITLSFSLSSLSLILEERSSQFQFCQLTKNNLIPVYTFPANLDELCQTIFKTCRFCRDLLWVPRFIESCRAWFSRLILIVHTTLLYETSYIQFLLSADKPQRPLKIRKDGFWCRLLLT